MKNSEKENRSLPNDDYYKKISFYNQPKFLIVWLFIIVIYPFLFLPEIFSKPKGWDLVNVFIYFALFAGLSISIISDFRKPTWMKRMFSISLIVLLVILFTFYSGANWSLIKKRFLNFETLDGIIPIYWDGLKMSLRLTIISATASLSIGSILGILRSLKNPVLENFIAIYIDIFRSIPLIALMIFVFYAVPFLGINLPPLLSASLALTLMYSAYIAEIVRAGLESVHHIQIEAAQSLGMSILQTTKFIIIPQAMRVIIPPLTSSLVGIIKDTSVAYVVTLPELLTRAQQVMVTRVSPLAYFVAALVYFAILFPLTQFALYLEKRSQTWSKKAMG